MIGFSQTINNLQFIHNLQFIQNPQFIQNNIFGNEIDNNKYRLLFHILRSNGLEDCLPNINNTNSLSLTQHETMREKFDIIAADIPYGSNGRLEVNLYPIKSSHIDVNFMQHIFFSLKAGGKAAVIIPTELLYKDTDRGFRILMLECCQITEIIDLPTNNNFRRSIIFFTKYRTTTNIKYTKYSSMNNLGLFYHDCSVRNISIIDIITNDHRIVFE